MPLIDLPEISTEESDELLREAICTINNQSLTRLIPILESGVLGKSGLHVYVVAKVRCQDKGLQYHYSAVCRVVDGRPYGETPISSFSQRQSEGYRSDKDNLKI